MIHYIKSAAIYIQNQLCKELICTFLIPIRNDASCLKGFFNMEVEATDDDDNDESRTHTVNSSGDKKDIIEWKLFRILIK